jgi:hypothetical protein
VIVDDAWNRDRHESEVSLAKGKATLEGLVEWFLTSSRAAAVALPGPALSHSVNREFPMHTVWVDKESSDGKRN